MRPPVLRPARHAVTSVSVAVALALGLSLPAAPPASSTPPLRPPPGAGWVDVTQSPYHARGDGRSDDTAALQAAIHALTAAPNRARVLYLPPGTYLVRHTLEWRDTAGRNAARLRLHGAGRGHTTLRLADHAPGFDRPAAPRAVLHLRSEHNPAWYAHSPQGEALGEGHLAFYNGLQDLTIDTGTGNPGAVGADVHVSNMGGIVGVTVRSGDGSGVAGLDLTRRHVGPGLLEDVRIEGFSVGLRFAGLFALTGEHLLLLNQGSAAVENRGGVLALREFEAVGPAPFVRNPDPGGLVVLVDSRFHATAPAVPDQPAVSGEGAVRLIGVSTRGLALLAETGGVRCPAPSVDDWCPPDPLSSLSPPPPSLRLPVREPPSVPALGEALWTDVRAHGADPEDALDDTAAIQRALDSGRPGVVFPNWSGGAGRYTVTAPLRIPPSVRVIEGAYSNVLVEHGTFDSATEVAPLPLLEVVGQSSEPLFIRGLFLHHRLPLATTVDSLRHASPRPVVLRHLRFSGIANGPGAGPLFLADVSAHTPQAGQLRLLHPQSVWARQLNLEDARRPKILAGPGVRLWVLGLKTERPSTILRAWGDAEVEILGGLHYNQHPSPEPMYRIHDHARVSASFATAGGGPGAGLGFPVLAELVRPGRPPGMIGSRDARRRLGDPRLAVVPRLILAPDGAVAP